MTHLHFLTLMLFAYTHMIAYWQHVYKFFKDFEAIKGNWSLITTVVPASQLAKHSVFPGSHLHPGKTLGTDGLLSKFYKLFKWE